MNLDGIIGMDVLENFNSLKIDYTKKIIEFNGTYPNKKKGIKMFHQEQNISGLNIFDRKYIAGLVSTHMGQWNTDYKTKEVILKKTAKNQKKIAELQKTFIKRLFLAV